MRTCICCSELFAYNKTFFWIVHIKSAICKLLLTEQKTLKIKHVTCLVIILAVNGTIHCEINAAYKESRCISKIIKQKIICTDWGFLLIQNMYLYLFYLFLWILYAVVPELKGSFISSWAFTSVSRKYNLYLITNKLVCVKGLASIIFLLTHTSL